MKSVKDLKVYQMAFDVVLKTYALTELFPQKEQYGLVSQMRRSAVSVCSNLAEGCSRETTKEYLHFVCIAKGSASELDCQIDIACALGFINKNDGAELKQTNGEILKMLSGLVKTLTTNTNH